MFKKFALGAAAALTAATLAPTAAQAQYYSPGYYGAGYYDAGYDRYDRYDRRDDRRWERQQRRYDRRADRRYYRDRHRGNYCRDEGNGGTIIGAIAGGLLGHEVAGRGDRTVGTIIGGAAGALAGRAIDRDC
ncbi:glycine zipper 2TM domain-containing protein [Sphingosinicella humi]|uniref:17 kDa surface antigen n=1 Tax=Allosphingosinicella humi TaxID=2068657 RepID=A0A2U2J1Z6_9SPHN|nr:glycine zipper 2TM domain-containing protein [Sphingosinicella humi]PWG02332.1 hypothetical protein DF286_05240 [Sphingosinicella humi]